MEAYADPVTHYVDGLMGANAPWVIAGAVALVLCVAAFKLIRIYERREERAAEIEERREQRKADEARMRDEREREGAANAARMVDALNHSADGDQAMAAALNAISVRLDASQGRSEHMGEQMDDVHGTVGVMARQVDDIHAATVRRGKGER